MAKFCRGTTEIAAEFPELVPGMMNFAAGMAESMKSCRLNAGHGGACCWIAEFDCCLDGFDAETMEFGRRNGEIVAEMAEC